MQQLERDLTSQCLTDLIPQGISWELLRVVPPSRFTLSRSFFKRKTEFLAGRRVAFAALQRAGLKSTSIGSPFNNYSADSDQLSEEQLLRIVGRNPDRSPRWPEGFVGSISHSSSWIVAIASRSDSYQSLGVDTELIGTDESAASLKGDIGCPAEWDLFENLGIGIATAFTVLFSAKEALYKCWYPKHQRHLNFSDVKAIGLQLDAVIEVDDYCAGTIELKVADEASQFAVRYMVAAENIFAVATQNAEQMA